MLRTVKVRDEKLGELSFAVLVGGLGILEGTWLAPLVRVVSAEAVSHATHGYILPLMKELGPEPKYLVKRLDASTGWCSSYGPTCPGSSPSCRPGPTVPACWRSNIGDLAGDVVQAWRDGLYVVVVDGDEFSLS